MLSEFKFQKLSHEINVWKNFNILGIIRITKRIMRISEVFSMFSD